MQPQSYQYSKQYHKYQKIKSKKDNIDHQQQQFIPYQPYQTRTMQEIETQMMPIQINSKLWLEWSNSYFQPLKLQNILHMRYLCTNSTLLKYFPTDRNILESFVKDNLPTIKSQNILYVLIRSWKPYLTGLVKYEIIEENDLENKRIKQENQDQLLHNIHIYPQRTSKIINIEEIDPYSKKIQQQEIQLNLIQQQYNQQQCSCMIKVQEQYKNSNESSKDASDSLDQQILLWQWQLIKQNSYNNIQWNSLINRFNENSNSEQDQDYSQQIVKIKEYLMWNTVKRYFEIGFHDKTTKQLQALLESLHHLKPPKTSDKNVKKFFETDCKICFCSFNYDCNQVLYCDNCNTSFHQVCYGLTGIPQQDQYYCDCCREKKQRTILYQNYNNDYNSMHNNGSLVLKKVTCQICCKSNFPIKLIENHYYHITCAIIFGFSTLLFDIVCISKGQLRLKPNVTHQSIQQQVISNELQHHKCQLCVNLIGSQLGMQMKCEVLKCPNYMHPICAYINGCYFQTNKENTLKIAVYCQKHSEKQRNLIEQIYLRRYMCNFKDTSNKSMQQFKYLYQQQQNNRQKNKQISTVIQKSNLISFYLKKHIKKIAYKNKIIKKYIINRENKLEPMKLQTEAGKLRQNLKNARMG